MSNWKKSPFRSTSTLRDRWPIAQDLIDPWAGDEILYPIEDQKHAHALFDATKLKSYLAWAKEQGLSKTIRHDDSHVQKATHLCSLDFLANLTEDWVPDIGLFAQERVLGPFAPYPKLKRLCGAILCFSPLLKHGITAAGRFADTQNSAHKIALGIQAKSPCMIWEREENNHVQPLLAVAKHLIPKGEVQGLPQSRFFVARMCPTNNGWTTSCVLPVPMIHTSYIHNMLILEWIKLQQSGGRMFWEDVLRYRAELIYRSTLEYCFIHAYEETLACWESFLSPVVGEN